MEVLFRYAYAQDDDAPLWAWHHALWLPRTDDVVLHTDAFGRTRRWAVQHVTWYGPTRVVVGVTLA